MLTEASGKVQNAYCFADLTYQPKNRFYREEQLMLLTPPVAYSDFRLHWLLPH